MGMEAARDNDFLFHALKYVEEAWFTLLFASLNSINSSLKHEDYAESKAQCHPAASSAQKFLSLFEYTFWTRHSLASHASRLLMASHSTVLFNWNRVQGGSAKLIYYNAGFDSLPLDQVLMSSVSPYSTQSTNNGWSISRNVCISSDTFLASYTCYVLLRLSASSPSRRRNKQLDEPSLCLPPLAASLKSKQLSSSQFRSALYLILDLLVQLRLLKYNHDCPVSFLLTMLAINRDK